jgi:ABC-type protease/lipase transport system fused ATPase/permease subunit
MMDRGLAGSADDALRAGRAILVTAFVLSFFVNVLRLVGPMFMILIYDRVLPSRSEETLVVLFVMAVTFLLALAVIDYARRRILARFGAQFQERMEVRLFAGARQGELFEGGRTKPVTGLDEVDGLRGFFHSASLVAIFDFFWAPMFVAVVFILDPLLGWVCLAGMVLILVLVMIRMLFIGTRVTDAAAASRGITDLRTMVAASRDTIRSQEMGRGFKDRWLAARRNARDRAIALKDWTVWFDSLCDACLLLVRFSMLAVGAWLVLEGRLTIGAMVAATFLVSRAILPVERFLTNLPDIAEAWRNWGQLKKLLAAKSAEQADPFVDEGGNPRARLSLVNVSVRSPLTGASILKSVTLEIAPGQMVQIVGPTGRGKTVLAETIMGLWKRSGGSILVNGINLSRMTDEEGARAFGYVPEAPGFVAGTLAENIARLDPEASPAKVAAAARKACLHATISALPDGYQTQIDPAGAGLSRGQRHQLALARAVYQMPDLLIIDEPDAVLTDLIPKTLEKTLDQLLEKGGSILVFARKPLGLRQISASYQLNDGRLELTRTGANRQTPAPKITVVPDPAPGKILRG